MPPRRTTSSGAQSTSTDAAAARVVVDRLGKVRPPNSTRGSLEVAELLPFQRNLLQQLVPPEDGMPNMNDAMVIMARGLGLRTVVTTFLKIYDIPEKLVLLVNATPEEERGFAEEVGMRLKVVAHEMPEAQREKMYKDGGLFSVTSRILIVDMLKKTIPVHLITGLVVLHAEEQVWQRWVRPTSPEAFIVNLYRRDNKIGFLKAFSDRPEAFTYGISPLQTTLVQLKLREVIILPRFHDDVNDDLQRRKADVVELYQPLTPAMLDIQTAILECMELTLSEVKRSNTYLELDDLTVENALFSSFDRIVRSQLDPVWHKVGPKTRSLVYDLSTLRKLQDYLLAFDCVRFNQYLETLLSSHSTALGALDRRERPAWLGTPAADTIFTVARNRVYTQKPVPKDAAAREAREMTVDGMEIPNDLAEEDWMIDGPTDEEEQLMRDLEETARMEREAQLKQSDPNGATTSGAAPSDMPPPAVPSKASTTPAPTKRKRTRWLPPGVEPVLEAQPKWSLLEEVLDEIETQMHWAPHDEYGYSKETILVMCNSSDTCLTLGDYLSTEDPSDDHRRLLESRLNRYFYWKAHVGRLQTSLRRTPGFNKGERRPQSGPVPGDAGKSSGASTSLGNKRAADDTGELSAALQRKDMRRGQAPPNKRRRVRGGGAAGTNGTAGHSSSTNGSGTLFAVSTGANPEALEEDAKVIASMVGRDDTLATVDGEENADDQLNELDFRDFYGFIANEELVTVRPYLGDEDDRVLEELRPKYVVLYDPSPAFVRRIEAYRAAHQNLAIRVYFLVYKDSVEEQRYLSEIRREKDAFVRLIEEKGSMAIPHEAEYRAGEEQVDLLRTVNTRIGGKKALAETPKVIVDMREFRSSLPGILYGGGFEVIPVTLGIGDYIITPEMAVERKSIPDLMQSFNSGRLFQQCELMTAHYKEPILLIEFDEKKSFNLETYIEARSSTSASEFDLRQKLVLLTITFPKLRVIWSSSPYQTVEIFRDLKDQRAEPDSATAQKVGLEENEAALAGVEGEAGFNLAPQDILRSLPGVNSKNYRYLSTQVENLEALVQLDLNEIQALIGVEPGKQLHGFIHSDLFLAT
ncbi:hypothetical protein BMF94_2736 [Rhodotorula taiwanensis]|uniref:ERCC4 domain-containing protein n=1 Tax=Rhodotorula taiwanensis TaxID=741276 RepID=A0A2S5BBK1_9BASI|nr:hypothetical protein BMF94_2736 [Rhodotorula taiwanensis]